MMLGVATMSGPSAFIELILLVSTLSLFCAGESTTYSDEYEGETYISFWLLVLFSDLFYFISYSVHITCRYVIHRNLMLF